MNKNRTNFRLANIGHCLSGIVCGVGWGSFATRGGVAPSHQGTKNSVAIEARPARHSVWQAFPVPAKQGCGSSVRIRRYRRLLLFQQGGQTLLQLGT